MISERVAGAVAQGEARRGVEEYLYCSIFAAG
jgi:hypothetical protein